MRRRRIVLAVLVAVLFVLLAVYASWPRHGCGHPRRPPRAVPASTDDEDDASPEPAPSAEPPPEPPTPEEDAEVPFVWPDAGGPRGLALRYVPRSTRKLEQLVGDLDKERNIATRSRTLSRFGLEGADLAYSFDHQGKTYFLFGDAIGSGPAFGDAIATADVRDPEAGVTLDFLTDGRSYATIQPPGVSMGASEVPVSGISAGGQMYVVVMTDHGPTTPSSTLKSVLTRFRPPSTFTPLRTISALPDGKFVHVWMHAEPDGATTPGLPSGGPWIFLWGTGRSHESDLSLAIVPAAQLESGEGTLYFAGVDPSGRPGWSRREAEASPVRRGHDAGDFSFTWSKDLGSWIALFDHQEPPGVFMTYAPTPWGPFPEAQHVFGPVRDGAMGKWIHDPRGSDRVAGPILGRRDPSAVRGGVYAPYAVERWTRLQDGRLHLYYVVSTFNPYVVVLMTSELRVMR